MAFAPSEVVNGIFLVQHEARYVCPTFTKIHDSVLDKGPLTGMHSAGGPPSAEQRAICEEILWNLFRNDRTYAPVAGSQSTEDTGILLVHHEARYVQLIAVRTYTVRTDGN